MEDKLSLLHQSLLANPNVKGLPQDYETFKNALSDSTKAQSFYQSIKANPKITGLPDTFDQFYSAIAPRQQEVADEKAPKGTLGQGIKHGATELAQGARLYTGAAVNTITGEAARERKYDIASQFSSPEERGRAQGKAQADIAAFDQENKEFLDKYNALIARAPKAADDNKSMVIDAAGGGGAYAGAWLTERLNLSKEERQWLRENEAKYKELMSKRGAMSQYAGDIEKIEKDVAKKGEAAAMDRYEKAHSTERWGERQMREAGKKIDAIPEMRGFAYNIGKMIPQVAGSAAGLAAAYFTGGSAPLLTSAIGTSTMAGMSAGSAGLAYKEYKDYMAASGREVNENEALFVGAGAGLVEFLSEKIPFDMVVPKSAMTRMIAKDFAENPKVGIDLIERWAKKHPQKYTDFLKKKGVADFVRTGNAEGMSEVAAELGQMAFEDMYKDPEDRATLNEVFKRLATSYAAGSAVGGFLKFGEAGVQHRMSYLRHKDGVALATTKDNPNEIYEVVKIGPDKSVILMDNMGNESVVSTDQIDQRVKVNKEELDELLTAIEQGKGKADAVKREIIAKRHEDSIRQTTKDYVSEDGTIEILQDASNPNMQYAYLGRTKLSDSHELIFIYDPETGQKKGVNPRSVVQTGQVEDYESYVKNMTDQAVNEYFQAEEDVAAIDAEESPAEILPGDKLLYQGKEVEVESVFPDGTVRAFDPSQGIDAAFTISPTDAAMLQPVVSGTQEAQALPEQIEVNGKSVKLEALDEGTTIISKPFPSLVKAQAEAEKLNSLFDAYEFRAIEFKPKDKTKSKRVVVTISEKAQPQENLSQGEVAEAPDLQGDVTANPAPKAPQYTLDGQEITRAKAKAKILKAKSKGDLASLQIGDDAELQGLIDEKFPHVPAKYVYDGREIDRETAIELINDATSPDDIASLEVQGDEEVMAAAEKIKNNSVSLQTENTEVDGQQSDNTEVAGGNPVSQSGEPVEYREDSEGADAGSPDDAGRGDSRIGRATVGSFTFSDEDVAAIRAAGEHQIIDDSVTEINDPQLFHDLISASKVGNKFSASVYVYPVEVYAGMRLFITNDGKAGVALTKEGDLVSVFSHAEGKNRAMQLVRLAIKEGAVTNDCFNTILPTAYSKLGFEPVAKVKWDETQKPEDWDKATYSKYNNGEPDVVLMVYTGKRIDDAWKAVEALPYSDSYDAAQKIQITTILGVEFLGVQPSGNPNGEGDLDMYNIGGATFTVPKGSGVNTVKEARDATAAKFANSAARKTETEKTTKRRSRLAEKVASTVESNKAVTDKIKAAESVTNTKPTEGQKEAGNYQKGKINWNGLEVSIENPAGSIRKGTDKNGKDWAVKLKNAYGYFNRTNGKDGDHVDVFFGDYPTAPYIYVIDQIDEKGQFDEHKVMAGFRSMQEAEAAYLSNYEQGWSNYATITEMTPSTFKTWLIQESQTGPASPLFVRSKKVIAGMLEDWNRKANNAAKLVLVEKQDDLPEHLNDKAAVIDGVYDPASKKVYIVLGNIKNSAHAAKVWIHEQAVHKGLRTLFSGREDYNNRLRLIYESVKDSPQMSAIKEAYPTLDEVGLADEYLAYLGETFLNGDNVDGWQNFEVSAWNKFSVWFRSMIRTIVPDMKVSDLEIASILLDSYRAVHGQTPLFRRANLKNGKDSKPGNGGPTDAMDYLEGRTDDPDVRQRLGDVFDGSSESTTQLINTPEFKEWFGESKVVDKNGKPIVMYHGTNADFTTFRNNPDYPRRPGIFVAPNPKFTDEFTSTGGSVMPLYVRAERPFDYENGKDVDKLLAFLGQYNDPENSIVTRRKDRFGRDPQTFREKLQAGDAQTIEGLASIIEDAGFDSYYVQEYGNKNLAVLYPNQLKSATGNTGEFSREDDDIRYRKSSTAGASASELAAAHKAWAAQGVKSPYFKAWFGDWTRDDAEGVSEILDANGWPMLVRAGYSDVMENREAIMISVSHDEDGYYANIKRPFVPTSDEHIEALAEAIALDEKILAEFNRLRNDLIVSIGATDTLLQEAKTALEVEEFIQEAIDLNTREFSTWMAPIVRSSGLFDGMVINPDPENFEGLAFDASQLAAGMPTMINDIAIEEGASAPILPPAEINDIRHRKARPVQVKEGYKLSYVSNKDIIDIEQLISEIHAKKQKVWFWQADQLGRGLYYDTVINDHHFLDAGPSYALDPENRNNGIVWASSAAPKMLQKNIGSADYIFIVSGSPTISHGFNKSVFELFKKRVEAAGDFTSFKKDVIKNSTVSDLTHILKLYKSFDELFDAGQIKGSNPKQKYIPRKKLLEILDDQAKKIKESPLTKALAKHNALLKLDDLRDDFYLENGFDIGDVMLVLKPSDIAQNAGNHSTYLHDIKGEVIGVPDKIINSYDLIPNDQMKMEYNDKLSDTMKMQIVAPYGMGIKSVTPERLDIRYRKQVTLPTGQKVPRMIGSRGEYLRELLQDRMISLRNLQDEVKKRGGTLDETMDAYTEENRSASKASRAIKNFDRDIMEPMLAKMSDIVSKTGVSLEELQKYMKAKHAPERNMIMQAKTGREVNAGMETAEARKYAAEIEKRLGAANIAELWRHIRKSTDFVLKRYLQDGFISRETYDSLVGNAAKGIPRMYEFYVPLRGWKMKERPEDIFEYLDGADRQSFSPMRNAEGRVTEADDPIAYIQSMAHSAIAAGEKNVVKQHAARMVFANQGEEYEDLFYMKKIWKVKTGEVDPVTNKEIEIEVTEKPDDALFKAGKARFGYNRGTHEAFKTSQMADQHEVDVYIAGDRYTMVFQDPSVANAIDKRNTWAAPLTLLVQKWFGTPTRIMSALMTSKNPAFIPLNLIRDVGYTMTSLTMQGDISSKDVFLGYNKAFGAIKRNLYSNGKKFDPVNNNIDRLYKEFLDNGGETGFVHLKDIQQVQKEMERKVRRLKKEITGGKTTVDYLAGTFEAVNKQLDNLAALSENASRFAVYMAARNAGKTINQSIDSAKNVTVNFNRKGRITGFAGSFFAFFNAAIQGGHNVFRLGKRHSKKFAIGAAMFTALGYALAKLNIELGGDDEEEVPQYQLLSDWVKHTNIVIPDFRNPGKFITIPLPHGFRAFYSLGVLINQVENGEKTLGQAAGSAMGNLMDGVSPVNLSNFYDKNDGKPTIRPLIPTIGVPIYDVVVNKDFLGNEIYNKPFMSTWDGKIADAKLGKSYVSKPIAALTDWLYEKGSKGDNDNTNMYVEDGKLKKVSWVYDWNPSKIEHILSGYFGGLGTFGVNLTRTASGIIEAADQVINEDKKINEAISESMEINYLPVVNRLYQHPWKESYIAKYKVVKEQVEAFDFEMQQNKRDKDYEDISKLYELSDLNTMSTVYNITKKKISEVLDAAYESGDPDTIAEAMEQRERMMQETVVAIENAIGTKIKF